MPPIKKIELFFLNTLLQICLVGISIILLVDFFLFPEDKLSLAIDGTILMACGVAFAIRKQHPTYAVLTITLIVLAAMIYQCLVVPLNTTTSLSILLVVGFVCSVMLKGRLMHIMHLLVIVSLISIFVLQYSRPELRFSSKANDVITVTITYAVLYFILTFSTAVLKGNYDRVHDDLHASNNQLQEKANKIIHQNQELVQIQEKLNSVNRDLEKIVYERTAKIQHQNEILYKFSYTNAHHLRGPVARLLGLANIFKLEPKPEPEFIVEKMSEQAKEIDQVIRQINVDLEANNKNLLPESLQEPLEQKL